MRGNPNKEKKEGEQDKHRDAKREGMVGEAMGVEKQRRRSQKKRDASKGKKNAGGKNTKGVRNKQPISQKKEKREVDRDGNLQRWEDQKKTHGKKAQKVWGKNGSDEGEKRMTNEPEG